MRITRTSPLTGEENTMELDVTDEQLAELHDSGRSRLIQDIFPDLSPDEREFLLTGYTAEDYEQMFPEEGEDYNEGEDNEPPF